MVRKPEEIRWIRGYLPKWTKQINFSNSLWIELANNVIRIKAIIIQPKIKIRAIAK